MRCFDKVETSGVDGSNRRVIATSGIKHPFALSIWNTTLYFTDWTQNSLKIISNFQNSSQQILRFCGTPYGIRVVDPSLQPVGMYAYITSVDSLPIRYKLHVIVCICVCYS